MKYTFWSTSGDKTIRRWTFEVAGASLEREASARLGLSYLDREREESGAAVEQLRQEHGLACQRYEAEIQELKAQKATFDTKLRETTALFDAIQVVPHCFCVSPGGAGAAVPHTALKVARGKQHKGHNQQKKQHPRHTEHPEQQRERNQHPKGHKRRSKETFLSVGIAQTSGPCALHSTAEGTGPHHP